MKELLKRTAALCGAAALVAVGGLTVSAAAAEEVPVPLTAAVQTVASPDETAIVTVPVTEGDTDAYDIVMLDTQSTKSSSSKQKSPNWVKIILISLGISLAVTGVAVWLIYRSYKYNGMTEPYEFKNKAPLDLKEREDALIDVHVTSVHINRNNDN